MTLQSFADIESNNNLADPEVRTTMSHLYVVEMYPQLHTHV